MRAMAGNPRERREIGKLLVDREFLAEALGERLLDRGGGGRIGR